MKEIAKAIQAVMEEVKGIDKTQVVGTGSSSYKGVPDQEVKKIIGGAMQKHGLCLLPIGVEPTTRIDRWEETYSGQSKPKQAVFTEVKTKYLLLHTSGESIEVCGYGHGTDSQDKGAGKSTTYALKYTLLYMFLVPTGKIDDADNSHSDSYETPKERKNGHQQTIWLTDEQFQKAMKADAKGINATLVTYGLPPYAMTPEQSSKLNEQLKSLNKSTVKN